MWVEKGKQVVEDGNEGCAITCHYWHFGECREGWLAASPLIGPDQWLIPDAEATRGREDNLQLRKLRQSKRSKRYLLLQIRIPNKILKYGLWFLFPSLFCITIPPSWVKLHFNTIPSLWLLERTVREIYIYGYGLILTLFTLLTIPNLILNAKDRLEKWFLHIITLLKFYSYRAAKNLTCFYRSVFTVVIGINVKRFHFSLVCIGVCTSITRYSTYNTSTRTIYLR